MKRVKMLLTHSFSGIIVFIIFFALFIFDFDTNPTMIIENFTDELEFSLQQNDLYQTYSTILSDEFEEDLSILFKTSNLRMDVLLDDEKIYSFGFDEQRLSFLKTPGTMWHVIDLPENSSGKTLTLNLYSVYPNYYGHGLTVYYGTNGDCYLAFLSSCLPILIINSIVLFMGMFCICLQLLSNRSQSKLGSGCFICVGIFSILVAIRSLCQSGILQFVSPVESQIWYMISFSCFYLLMSPFNHFLLTISQWKKKNGYLFFMMAYFALYFLSVVLNVSGIADLSELVPLYHILMILNEMYIIYAVSCEVVECENIVMKPLRKPLCFGLLFSMVEIFMNYVQKFNRFSIFLPVASILLVVTILWIQGELFYRSMFERDQRVYYEKMAKTDLLTSSLNRNAYEKVLEEMVTRDLRKHPYCAIFFDVNDLKCINDSYGHDMGDDAIKRCYQCILEAFKIKDYCFRVGGDEFVCFSDRVDTIQNDIAKFHELVKKMGEEVTYPFRIAVGYACFDEKLDRDFEDTIHRGDNEMYQYKRVIKKTSQMH